MTELDELIKNNPHLDNHMLKELGEALEKLRAIPRVEPIVKPARFEDDSEKSKDRRAVKIRHSAFF